MRRFIAAAAAAALVTLCMVAVAGPAFAHAELRASSPSAGDRLEQAPERLQLDFTEGVALARDGIRLLDAAGEPQPIGDPRVSGGLVTVPVRALGQGAYVLVWRVVSSDSHPVQGAVPFAVGDADPPPVEGLAADGDRAVAAVLASARFIGYAGTALLIGSAALVAWCWPAGRRRIGVRRSLLAGSTMTAGAAGVGFLAQGPYAAGRPLSGLTDIALLQDTAGIAYGVASLGRLVLVGAFTAWALASPTRGAITTAAWRAAGAGLGLSLAATFSVQGHAWAAAERSLAVAVDAAHVFAMSVWLGGLAVLAAVATRPGGPEPSGPVQPRVEFAVPVPAVPGPQQAVAMAESASAVAAPESSTEPATVLPDMRRWSHLAMAAVAVLAATGTLAGLREVGGWSALTGTDYGRLLLIKLALFAAILALAARARAWVQCHTGEPPAAAHQPPERSLRAPVLGEAGLGAVVLAVTAVLVATTPAAAGDDSVRATGNLPDGTVATVTTDESRLIAVRVDRADGEIVLPVQVSAAASLPGRGVENLPIELHASGETWAAHDDPLPFPGAWRVSVTVRTSELDAGVTTVTLPVP